MAFLLVDMSGKVVTSGQKVVTKINVSDHRKTRMAVRLSITGGHYYTIFHKH